MDSFFGFPLWQWAIGIIAIAGLFLIVRKGKSDPVDPHAKPWGDL